MKFLNWKIIALFWVFNGYYIVDYSSNISPFAWECYSDRYVYQEKFTTGILIYLICTMLITLIISDIHLYKRRMYDSVIIKCLLITIALFAIFFP